MTIKQLIKILSQIQDQDTRVMVKGYEGGYDDVMIINPTPLDMALDVNNEWYYGKHEIQNFDHEYKDKQIVKAIVL